MVPFANLPSGRVCQKGGQYRGVTLFGTLNYVQQFP